MGRHHLTALVAGLVLVVPSSALAQSAGDNQYEDPFAGSERPQQPGDDVAPSQTGTEAPDTSVPTASTQAGTAAVPTDTAPGAELPRTGEEPVWWLLAGLVAVASGWALHRRLAPGRSP
ncbi:MAG: LPXTG cell wall anchor domain-containing protein [Thermoleophilaceae bacterium]|nr:LPXTG cell wall anchor domain-containing protein [Thermoleophilaceae bacterium]